MTLQPPIYHPGLEGVFAGISSICDVDPETGGLLYRGYSVEELSLQATFEELAYLLFIGRLPSPADLEAFLIHLLQNRALPGQLLTLFQLFPASTHPMDALRAAVSMLGCLDPTATDPAHEANLRKAIRLTAIIPTIIAAYYKHVHGQPPIAPDPQLSHCQNFFRMLTGRVPDAFIIKVFNTSMILYAEHEFNASTFSARVTASTLSDLYSAITSAIGTLKGRLHGGANEQVMRMLLEINRPESAVGWVQNALGKKKRVPGFGHRVYKKGDSRALVIKRFSKELGERAGGTKWYEMSCIIEEIMRKEKDLYPNLDFYSASAYYLMDLPLELYTPIFVMSRITGWCAHVIEQQDDNRLIRPRCAYNGPRGLKYVPVDQRI